MGFADGDESGNNTNEHMMRAIIMLQMRLFTGNKRNVMYDIGDRGSIFSVMKEETRRCRMIIFASHSPSFCC